jgi:hypothetical protein
MLSLILVADTMGLDSSVAKHRTIKSILFAESTTQKVSHTRPARTVTGIILSDIKIMYSDKKFLLGVLEFRLQ